jgi:phosphatidylglycerophosphate synthase
MKSESKKKTDNILKVISADRQRTNLLKNIEQKALAYLVQRIPAWVTPDMLTTFGLSGSILIAASFVLAAKIDHSFLLLGVLGFIISWFGDSLDGRTAYYRNKPRKQYGFALDITIDWIGIISIGCGYMIYARKPWDLLGYIFVVFYGWEMIIALIRYKLTGKYSIDAGKLGPTEARIILMSIFVAEALIPDSIFYLLGMAVLLVFTVNIIDTRRLLLLADQLDKQEKKNNPSP